MRERLKRIDARMACAWILLAMLAVFLIREGYLPTPPGKDRSPSP